MPAKSLGEGKSVTLRSTKAAMTVVVRASRRRERPALAYVSGILLLLWLGACTVQLRSDRGSFDVVETSITEIHTAMLEGTVTARELVEAYQARIEAYDKRGPALNSIITMNTAALARAAELDEYLASTGELFGPLHGIPIIVKDNYDTSDIPTTGGSAALAGSLPPDDAYMVERIREAGGIVLAKSNMAEFAFSPYETIGSALPGYTRNPYATNRVTAGSSGGTAAAVAASFGAVGLGTDTGNSIRGPSSHQALVGIRSTMGLTSRDGVIPLNLERDIAGPMARTVADAVAVFQVVVGYDPADPITQLSEGRPQIRYADHLNPRGLEGRRIGVARQVSDTRTADPEVLARFNEALEDIRRAGGTVVDSVSIGVLEGRRGSTTCGSFRTDLEGYLATLGPEAPVRTLQDIVDSGRAHSSVRGRLQSALGGEAGVPDSERCQTARDNTGRFREGLQSALAEQELDALVYPTWGNPPRLIGDLQTPHGDNSQVLSPTSGFPAVTVPMGYVLGGLPVGLQILGDAWSEGTLIEIAYAYEQATRHRRSPPTTPRLR